MPETKRPLKIFLCHAHADRDPVRGLPAGTRLTKDGVENTYSFLLRSSETNGSGWFGKILVTEKYRIEA
jgi:hypothetical protein